MKLKILIPLLILILLVVVIFFLRSRVKVCINYTLDEQHVIFNRVEEPQLLDGSFLSPQDKTRLEEISLDGGATEAPQRKAYYNKELNLFYILDIPGDYAQWFGPYNGHPCDQL